MTHQVETNCYFVIRGRGNTPRSSNISYIKKTDVWSKKVRYIEKDGTEELKRSGWKDIGERMALISVTNVILQEIRKTRMNTVRC